MSTTHHHHTWPKIGRMGNTYRYVAMLSHVWPACLLVSLDDITRAMKCGEREKLQEVSSLNFWIWKIMQYPWKHMEWFVFLRVFFLPPKNHKNPSGLPGTIHHSVPSPHLAYLTRSFCSPGAVECNHQGLGIPSGSSEEVSSCRTQKQVPCGLRLAKSSELVPWHIHRLYHDCISMVSCFFLFSCTSYWCSQNRQISTLRIQDSQKLTPHPSSPMFFLPHLRPRYVFEVGQVLPDLKLTALDVSRKFAS